jgi:hypothetical protein
MMVAMEVLNLDTLYVIYPGNTEYKITENIIVIGLHDFISKFD